MDHGYRQLIIESLNGNKIKCNTLTQDALNADKEIINAFLNHCRDNDLKMPESNHEFLLEFMNFLYMNESSRAAFIKYTKGINTNKLDKILKMYNDSVFASTDYINKQDDYIIWFLKSIIWPSP